MFCFKIEVIESGIQVFSILNHIKQISKGFGFESSHFPTSLFRKQPFYVEGLRSLKSECSCVTKNNKCKPSLPLSVPSDAKKHAFYQAGFQGSFLFPFVQSGKYLVPRKCQMTEKRQVSTQATTLAK